MAFQIPPQKPATEAQKEYIETLLGKIGADISDYTTTPDDEFCIVAAASPDTVLGIAQKYFSNLGIPFKGLKVILKFSDPVFERKMKGRQCTMATKNIPQLPEGFPESFNDVTPEMLFSLNTKHALTTKEIAEIYNQPWQRIAKILAVYREKIESEAISAKPKKRGKTQRLEVSTSKLEVLNRKPKTRLKPRELVNGDRVYRITDTGILIAFKPSTNYELQFPKSVLRDFIDDLNELAALIAEQEAGHAVT